MNAVGRLRRRIERSKTRRVVDVPRGTRVLPRADRSPDFVPRNTAQRRRIIKRQKRERAEARARGGLP